MQDTEKALSRKTKLTALGSAWFLVWFAYMLIFFTDSSNSSYSISKVPVGQIMKELGIVSLFFAFFPVTLFRFLTTSEIGGGFFWISLFGGWLGYFVLTAKAFFAKSQRLFFYVFTALCFLLLLNLAGCYKASRADDFHFCCDSSQSIALLCGTLST